MNTSQGDAVAVDPARTTCAPQRQEITFADGSAIWLHCVVDVAKQDCPYHREVQLDNGQWCLLDLRQLAPSLAYQLPGANTREAASAIFHGLRQRFASALLLREKITGRPAQ